MISMKYKKLLIFLGVGVVMALAAGVFLYRTTQQSVVEQPPVDKPVVQEPMLENNELEKTEKVSPGSDQPSLIRQCPDEWYENRMPSEPGGNNTERQYFVINGERKEIKDYDITWIKNNCSVQVQYVY